MQRIHSRDLIGSVVLGPLPTQNGNSSIWILMPLHVAGTGHS